MKQSKIFLKSLSKDWYKYLAVLILPILLASILSYEKIKIKNEEIIKIFTYCEVKDQSINSYVNESLKDEGILSTKVSYYPMDDNFALYLKTYGFEFSDLIFLPESLVNGTDDSSKEYYASLSYHFGDPTYENKYINAIKSINPKIEIKNYSVSKFGEYAVKVFEKGNDEYNSSIKANKFFSFSESTVLLIPKASDNLKNDVSFKALTLFA